MTKKILVAALAIVVLLIVILVGLGLFLDANQFRPRLEAMMSEAFGRKVTIGDLRVSWFSGGIAAQDLAIADDPAFGRTPFVAAKSLAIGVDLAALIFSRSLHVESFRLDHPTVTLVRSPSGVWNFSSFAASGSSSSSPNGLGAMGLLIQKITIAGGKLIVTGAAGRRESRTYDDVDVTVSNVSFTSAFPFQLSMKTPKDGSIKVTGEVGPPNMKNMAETPFHGAVTVRHLDVASTGFIDPSSGIAGMIDFTGDITSNGIVATTKGKATAKDVQLLRGGAASKVPIAIDYESSFNERTENGTLKQGDVHVGKALAQLTGSYSAGGKTPSVHMMLVGKAMPAADLEAALPAIGMAVPSGAVLKQGTLDLDLAIAGAAEALNTTGPVTLSNAMLTGFDLGEKLGALAAFAGLPRSGGGDTLIETLGATLKMTPSGLQIDGLNMLVPSVGTLTGEGTVGPTGALDFAMLAKLGAAVTNRVSGNFARAVSLGQTSGIPFKIQGTSSHPAFAPDLSRAGKMATDAVKDQVQDAVKNPDNLKKAVDALGGLFGRKKDQ
jgi:AsmA protein